MAKIVVTLPWERGSFKYELFIMSLMGLESDIKGFEYEEILDENP